MVDPVTALATASSAFSLIKRGFQAGRDIESMASDLGRWMGAMSDLDQAEKELLPLESLPDMLAFKSAPSITSEYGFEVLRK